MSTLTLDVSKRGEAFILREGEASFTRKTK